MSNLELTTYIYARWFHEILLNILVTSSECSQAIHEEFMFFE